MHRVFPFLSWFKNYKPSSLRADFISGLTVALVLIPQSMAYAQLAGLPAYYGLYASFLPPMVAALFGSSRQLATGPVAVVSLMTAASLEPLATAGGEAFVAYAILLALLVGLFQLGLGLLRLGMVVNFLSHPVVVGFTNAAALIIATSQLSKMFGVTVDKADHHYETIWRVAQAAFHFTHWPTFLLGALAFGLMIGLKKLSPRAPAVLVAVGLTTVISWATGFEDNRNVALENFQGGQVSSLVSQFNKDVADIALMSEARALLGSAVSELESDQDALCGSCHVRHDVELDALREESKASSREEVQPRTALLLHAKAGLLDRHIAELKQQASERRRTLRDLSFLEGTEASGLVYRVAAGEEVGFWRLKVGNQPLDPKRLVLTGGGAVVGNIPGGLPAFMLPRFDGSVLGHLLMAAIIISILGFMEAISIAKAMAARTGQRLDPNQELIGQGLANIAGAFSQSYAVSGSFSRSAVNIQAGAVSGMSSVFTSAVVVVALLFLTPLLYHLPQSVLAAVIMMAVVGLINFKSVAHAWRVKRSDGVISLITFCATLFFAPHLDQGILIGVALSIGVFLYDKMKPGVASLSMGTDGHLHAAQLRGLESCQHLAVLRFNGPLFFANTSYLEDQVQALRLRLPQLKAILVKAAGLSEIDATGEDMLSLLIERLRAGGCDIYFSGLTEQVVAALHRSHLFEKIGEDHVFATTVQALELLWPRYHKDSTEDPCPLTRAVLTQKVQAELPKAQILLVDDEEEFVEFLGKRLQKRGFAVTGCYDGAQAVAAVKERDFDAVVLDMKLKEETGDVVLRSLLELRPDLQVLLLTGHATVDTAVLCMKAGAMDYLLKPCDIDELIQKIQQAQRQRPDPASGDR